MADKANPFAFIKRLPDAVVTKPFEKHPGIFIQAGLVEGEGRNVFLEVIDGENVPTVTYTLNIGGRGSLVFGEQEFRDLVSVGLAVYEIRQASFFGDQPTPRSEAAPSDPTGPDAD